MRSRNQQKNQVEARAFLFFIFFDAKVWKISVQYHIVDVKCASRIRLDFPSISHTRTYHCYVANILQRSLWSILILCQKVGRLFRFPSTHTCLSQLYFSVFLLLSFLRMFIFFRIVYFSSNDFLIFLNVCFRSNSYKSGLFHLFIYYLWIACRFLLRLVQVPKAKKTFRSNKVYDLVTDSN